MKRRKDGDLKFRNEKQEAQSHCVFSVNGAQKRLIAHTPNHLGKQTEFWQGNFDGDFFRRFQAASFRQFWFWISTKCENQMNFFTFSAHQDSNLMNKMGDSSK